MCGYMYQDHMCTRLEKVIDLDQFNFRYVCEKNHDRLVNKLY